MLIFLIPMRSYCSLLVHRAFSCSIDFNNLTSPSTYFNGQLQNMGQHTPPDKALLKYMTHKYNTVIPKTRNFNLFHNENQEQLSIKLFFLVLK